jgi:hypothetical protein
MLYPYKLLFRSIVKPFFRENLSIFFFVFIVFFGIVGEVDGAEIWQFHYSLIRGMTQREGYQWIVAVVWGWYAWKCSHFVTGLFRRPEYRWIFIYNNLPAGGRFRLLLLVNGWLLLPVLLYGMIVTVIGCHYGHFLPVLLIEGYQAALLVLLSGWQLYRLAGLHAGSPLRIRLPFTSYPAVLLRQVFQRQPALWLGLKLFTCGAVYGIASNNTTADYDKAFPFLFFDFGILANGILIYGLREFEETYLSFYRGEARSLGQRLSEYALVYFILLLPELITVGGLTPVHLHITDAFFFFCSAYCLVLTMHGVTFLRHFSKKEYFLLLVMIFSVQYFFIMSFGLAAMCGCLAAVTVLSFFRGYYDYQRG